ncbi:LysR family transcriptional regulator [Vagococcus intermedius]|uniref:LysR family transcriptional regulator n=1 Tax=Vagococcus intermedius TaxID=2991418 RepID=A0AAF0I6P2_9ENTE|nr:LysR family transcriptional regulator [Vagococcus intermedius]WEG73693.1 LysR family transcriptional regulator [Vagococcus intermedius]WEG75777.1 LysR family transcriptional regulator [Vagococcus intermedius]
MLDYHYQTFLTLCHEKNYTLTAEKLFITQPAVTQHIKWLEAYYQTKLVSYRKRQFSLTPKGEELYNYLTQLQAQINKIETTMKAAPKELQVLNFAVTLSISDYYLTTIMPKLAKKFPDSHLNCLVENTDSILTKLKTGKLDFALIEGNFPKEYYSSHILSTEAFIGVLSQQNSLASKQKLDLNDLKNETLIIREKGSGSRHILDNLLIEQNLTINDFKRKIEIGSLDSMTSLVKENEGIAFLYQTVVANDLAKKTLKKISIPHLETHHQFNFIYLKDSLFSEKWQRIYHLLLPIFTSN